MLVSRNVTIGALRTSMRLEPEFWAALKEIARLENRTLDELCSEVDARRGAHSRTAAMRLFATGYFAARRADAALSKNRLADRRDAAGRVRSTRSADPIRHA